MTLPEGSGDSAVVTLNVPAPYSLGSYGEGGKFQISVDGTVLPAFAEYDYVIGMGSRGTVRVPTTLVVAVPLMLKKQTVVALAQNCIIDSTASLSAIV